MKVFVSEKNDQNAAVSCREADCLIAWFPQARCAPRTGSNSLRLFRDWIVSAPVYFRPSSHYSQITASVQVAACLKKIKYGRVVAVQSNTCLQELTQISGKIVLRAKRH